MKKTVPLGTGPSRTPEAELSGGDTPGPGAPQLRAPGARAPGSASEETPPSWACFPACSQSWHAHTHTCTHLYMCTHTCAAPLHTYTQVRMHMHTLARTPLWTCAGRGRARRSARVRVRLLSCQLLEVAPAWRVTQPRARAEWARAMFARMTEDGPTHTATERPAGDDAGSSQRPAPSTQPRSWKHRQVMPPCWPQFPHLHTGDTAAPTSQGCPTNQVLCWARRWSLWGRDPGRCEVTARSAAGPLGAPRGHSGIAHTCSQRGPGGRGAHEISPHGGHTLRWHSWGPQGARSQRRA